MCGTIRLLLNKSVDLEILRKGYKKYGIIMVFTTLTPSNVYICCLSQCIMTFAMVVNHLHLQGLNHVCHFLETVEHS